jgi:hypothetical protein
LADCDEERVAGGMRRMSLSLNAEANYQLSIIRDPLRPRRRRASILRPQVQSQPLGSLLWYSAGSTVPGRLPPALTTANVNNEETTAEIVSPA